MKLSPSFFRVLTMIKIVKNSIALGLLLSSGMAMASQNESDATHCSFSSTLSEGVVVKKARSSLREVNLLAESVRSNCATNSKFPEQFLLQSVEADALLHKKLPANMVASR
ncbi:hypothetical protein CA267_017135 [Alteromonas pelagimontana]|uniref:DUF3718 domain-containing protein n=1 Tax=Alteromonas pelagimontana TaxID=1858656 RepID=A0A6M4MIC1_9ALTE|nr:hypothetical protein [Alteromonas pelagimontana]QJR82350.1 hypothetical protein CA267_017135 [Alteromonas pelagimontana]